MVPVEKAILVVLGVEVLVAGCLPLVYFLSLKNERSRPDQAAPRDPLKTGAR